MDIDVGTKIREIRKAKSMTIAALAESCGVSTGLISQIERGTVVPSVVSLWKIASALDKSVGYFFDDGQSEKNLIVREADRNRIKTAGGSAVYELLSPGLANRKIEFLLISINPGEETANDTVTHEGEECGLVLKGTLTVRLGDTEYILNQGDSIYFDCSIPHRFANKATNDETCVSVWATTPPSF